MLVTKVTKIGFSQIYISYINLHVNKCVLGSNSQIFIVIEFWINQTKLQICSQYLNSNIQIDLQVFSVDRLLLILSSYCQFMGIFTVQILKIHYFLLFFLSQNLISLWNIAISISKLYSKIFSFFLPENLITLWNIAILISKLYSKCQLYKSITWKQHNLLDKLTRKFLIKNIKSRNSIFIHVI